MGLGLTRGSAVGACCATSETRSPIICWCGGTSTLSVRSKRAAERCCSSSSVEGSPTPSAVTSRHLVGVRVRVRVEARVRVGVRVRVRVRVRARVRFRVRVKV